MTASTTLAAALESALDLYLRQNPSARQKCAALAGRVIALELAGTGLTLYFLPDERGIQVFAHYEGEVDTRLTGTPAGFARLMLGSREDALFQGAVEIHGDTATGEQFQQLLAASELEWEELLSRFTGDVIAHQAGEALRAATRYLGEVRDTLAQDLSEYLQEEARLLPTRVEIDYFLDEVDEFKADVERLEARVRRLLARTEAGT
ncbi:MAG TPA: sterol-binding protein [Gammaproteobacteria bacterium]|nr:sterol-binding protein [Gammaproteobacteria bacterium]